MKLFASVSSMSAALCFAIAAPPAFASSLTQKDAIAMVERGAALMKAKGKDELIKRVNAKDPEFVQGELYLSMRDARTGIAVAHPYNPSIIGKDLTDVPDANGKKYRREFIDVASSKGKGWVDYMYKNPTSGKIEPKTTFVQKVDDLVLESGIYKK
jgi:cytochrome c